MANIATDQEIMLLKELKKVFGRGDKLNSYFLNREGKRTINRSERAGFVFLYSKTFNGDNIYILTLKCKRLLEQLT